MKKTFQIFLLLAVVPFFLSAQSSFQLKDSQVTVSGTSTLHDWTSTVTKVTTKVALEVEENTLVSIQSLEMEIPVKGIMSTKGKKMDNKTYAALKSESNPTILFKLLSVNSMTNENGVYSINATGDLTVAGVTQSIDLDVKGKLLDDQTISFEGKKDLKMTDFGMDPPTALLGTIRTGDEVIIDFNLTLVVNGVL